MQSFPPRDEHPGAALTFTTHLDELSEMPLWKVKKTEKAPNNIRSGWAAIQGHIAPHLADSVAYHTKQYLKDCTSEKFPANGIFYPAGMASVEQENKFYGPGVSSDLVPQSQRRTEIIKGDAKARPVAKRDKKIASGLTSLRQELKINQELAEIFSETATYTKTLNLQRRASEEKLDGFEDRLTATNTTIEQCSQGIASLRNQGKDKDKIDVEEYHRRTVQAFRDQLTVTRTSLDKKVQGLRFNHDEDLQAVQKQTQDAIDQLAQELGRLRETVAAKEKTMKTFFDKITNRIDGFEK
ncbi:hypothetical protein EDB82DRAFT_524073 [Fusarium venenatum]|uniref:uncharacterized protein n=1 Tax=Fusarium venenatum TaxID=56646 RepID=UPI001D92C43A|nr:hypothetical protein EDB82DRAFT_524073 [Fusarium venenatum]